jgi:hypothetical protein
MSPFPCPPLSQEDLDQLEFKDGCLILDLKVLRRCDESNDFIHQPRLPLHQPTYAGPVCGPNGPAPFKDQQVFFSNTGNGEAGGDGWKELIDLGELQTRWSDHRLVQRVYSFYRRCVELRIISSVKPLGMQVSSMHARIFHSLAFETMVHCFRLGKSWVVGTSRWRGFSKDKAIAPETLAPLFDNQSIAPLADEESLCAARVLVQFVHDLLQEGLPWFQGTSGFLYWRPLVISTSDGGRALTFGPDFDDVVLAVPQALAKEWYEDLARCYVLHKPGDKSTHFHLLGKSRIIGPPTLSPGLDSTYTITKGKVYGPFKGTWASVLDIVFKILQLGLENQGDLVKECLRTIKQATE